MSISSLKNANTHRVKEGARVLEDIARFILRNDNLFKKARELRHGLRTIPPFDDAQEDLGGATFEEKNTRTQLLDLVQANASRVQEALRVLEETSLTDNEKHTIKTLRYTAYRLQQDFYKETVLFLRQDKLKGLYLVIDPDMIQLPLEVIANAINQTSVSLVQFRKKHCDKQRFLQDALQLKKLLHSDKLLIINDHIDVALDIGDGVHLGQQDYPLDRVRQLLPEPFLLGVTCHSIEEAQHAEKVGASYISVGCLFPTQSKRDVIPTSLEDLTQIKKSVKIPVCAIGGITPQNSSAVLACHIDMVAVISAVWQAPDPVGAIEGFLK